MISDWNNHKAQLRAYIAKQLDDPSAVDDVLQEVYIKASRSLHQLKNQTSLKSWLYRITHNLIIDFYRSRQPYNELPENLTIEEKDPVEENYHMLAKCIKPLIHELPEQYKVPLELVELNGLTQKELAEKLGLSFSGAKSRVQRAREKFRQLLMKHCEFELSNRGVLDCSPKDKKGREYYKTHCK